MKLVYLLSWIGVLSIMVFLGDTFDAQNVSLGAIFSLPTITGQVSQIAMNAAVDDINSDHSILNGRKLSLQIYNSNSNSFLSIMGALQFMETDTVAIIGPQTSMMAHVLSHLANELHVPLLSFTALDPTLSPIQYPYFFQTAPNDLFQMSAIADMVNHFRWTQVIAIFTDDEQSRNGITALGDKLAEIRCKISYKAALPPRIYAANQSELILELGKVKLMESRVLVVHSLATYGQIILQAAEKLDMMSNGYIWIATSWLPSILESQPNSPVFKNAQGLLTLRHHTRDSPKKDAFIARWKHLSNGSFGLNSYGLYAYDTVWLVAHAVGEFLRQGNNISFSNDPVLAAVGGGSMNLSALSIFDGGDKLHNIILKTNMTGLTGPIWFDQGRFLFNPSFDVINVVGNQLRRIGYWSNYSGLSVVAPEILRTKPQNRSSASQRLNGVRWPGGASEAPRGWVFPRNAKLRVGVPYRVSFPFFVYRDNQTHAVRGYCIDVFAAAIKLLPYTVHYELILFGDGHKNPSYNELVRRVAAGEFDAAVGDIAIVTERTMIADFTQPYTDSGLVVVAPVRKLYSSAWAFLRPFTAHMWAVTGASFLIVGAVIWILEHRINDEFRGPPRQQLITMLWFSFSTLFFAHRENTVSALGRMVLVIWLFVVLIIQSSYTASLTSFLTVQQLSSPVKGIDSLLTSTKPIGYQVGSYADNYLNEELNVPKSRLKPLNSPEEYADALEKGRVAAVVDERPYVDMFLSNHCQFRVAGQEFTRSGWGFAFKRDSPLAVDMSTALLGLSESGGLQNISEAWLKTRNSCGRQNNEDDSDQLKLDNFIGLFLICAVACIVALIIYFFLMIYRFWHHSPQEERETPSNGRSRLTCLGTFFSFADKKEDLTKRKKRKHLSVPSNVIHRGEYESRGTSSQREEPSNSIYRQYH